MPADPTHPQLENDKFYYLKVKKEINIWTRHNFIEYQVFLLHFNYIKYFKFQIKKLICAFLKVNLCLYNNEANSNFIKILATGVETMH